MLPGTYDLEKHLFEFVFQILDYNLNPCRRLFKAVILITLSNLEIKQ